MPTHPEALALPVIFGRSSSHFTRVARIFAAELGVACSLHVVPDLLSCDPRDYGGNPALKLPTLRTPDGTWFGALQICRALWRSSARPRIVWPEDLGEPLAANAQELVVHAMATEVNLIMSGLAGADAPASKPRTSLLGTMAWLEDHAGDAIAALPADRALSYLEVTLFCLVTHLEFRGVIPSGPYPALHEFSRRFATRASAAATAYRFDA